MSCVCPCGDCPCDTCQLNVEADFDIRRAIDAYCYNCEDCCYMMAAVQNRNIERKNTANAASTETELHSKCKGGDTDKYTL